MLPESPKSKLLKLLKVYKKSPLSNAAEIKRIMKAIAEMERK